MKIALDAMGGDHAPAVTVRGAVHALRGLANTEVILVGDETQIRALLDNMSDVPRGIRVRHAGETVGMNESPVEAIRNKKDSSISVATRLCRDGEADGIVSAGNTGAAVAGATLSIGLIDGVKKPGIAASMPTLTGHSMVIDVGANIKCKPLHLLQYGIMAVVYSRFLLGKQDPQVGLLNIGEEDAKGNELVKETFAMLKESNLHFIGNLEGREVHKGLCDVIVCEGFTGNVILKLSEGLVGSLFQMIREELRRTAWRTLGAIMCRPAFRAIKERTDYRRYGAAPLLGVNGACLICHGGSDEVAIENAIKVASDFIQNHVNHEIADAIRQYSPGATSGR